MEQSHDQRCYRSPNGVFSLLLMLTSVSCTPAQNPLDERTDLGRVKADTILLGGVVASMDSEVVGATAVALLDYRIAAVGSDDEIRLWAGDETQVIELGGRLLVPGLIEGHGHFMSFGRAQQIIDLNDIQNWQQAVGRALSRSIRRRPVSGFLVAAGTKRSGIGCRATRLRACR